MSDKWLSMSGMGGSAGAEYALNHTYRVLSKKTSLLTINFICALDDVKGSLICTSFGSLKCTTSFNFAENLTAFWSVAEKSCQGTFRSLA